MSSSRFSPYRAAIHTFFLPDSLCRSRELALFTGNNSLLRLDELLFFFDIFGVGDSLHAPHLIHPLHVTSHQRSYWVTVLTKALDRSEEFTSVHSLLFTGIRLVLFDH